MPITPTPPPLLLLLLRVARSAVLQVLFHTPLLAAFFLGEGHDPSCCRLTAREKPCLSCQMVGRPLHPFPFPLATHTHQARSLSLFQCFMAQTHLSSGTLPPPLLPFASP